MNDDINSLNKYLLEQIKKGKLDKDYALAILKKLNIKNEIQREDIAIIGMACRLPGANTPEGFWEILKAGKDCIRSLPINREKDAKSAFPEGHRVQFFKAGYLDEIDKFDAEYFNIPPRNALLMDPYQRLFLETFIESLQDAGIRPDQIYGSNTGVFIGTDHTHKFKASYLDLIDKPDFTAMIGSWAGILTGRVSYMYNLKGPSIVVDSACSSGLSALYAACNALYMGDCNQAVVGGVNVFVMPTDSDGQMDLNEISNQKSQIRAFDKDASGTVWGEAVGSFIIKPLSEAIKNNDPIHAVIKSVAVNSDGASNGITAPNGKSQSQLIERAWKLAGISAVDMSYIEAHGTGTRLGDPIEIKALNDVFNKQTNRKQFCGIGSVKSNVGHAVGASSIISLVKVIMSLKNKQLPPTINFASPNPLIDFCNSALYVQSKFAEWETIDEKPRIAGINAFSFSGTNCHIVLSEAPLQIKNESASSAIFALSARTEELLFETINTFKDYLIKNNNVSWENLCYSVCVGREHFNHRFVIVAKSVNELIDKMDEYHQSNINISDKKNMQMEADTLIESIEEQSFMNTDTLKQIAALYIAGCDISWDRLYSGKRIQKIHLPVFPFKKIRYWTKIVPNNSFVATNSNLKPTIKEISVSGDYSQYKNVGYYASIWGNVLGYDNIDMNDHFYELGGDSISGMRIVSIINKEQGLELTPSILLEFPLFSDFVNIVNQKIGDSFIIENQTVINMEAGKDTLFPVSAAQNRMYILWQTDINSLIYNVTGCVVLPYKLQKDVVTDAFKKLVRKYESLRTVFVFRERLMQKILEDMQFEIELIDKSNQKYDNIETEIRIWAKEWVHPFDLHKGPLFMVKLIHLSENQSVLFLDFHHIISDGITIGLYVKDLETIFSGNQLVPAPLQYKDFTLWQNKKLEDGGYALHKEYWKSIFAEEVSVLELPLDFKRSINEVTSKGKRVSYQWDMSKTVAIERFSKENEYTMFIFLVASLNILLSKYSSQDDIVIGSPVNGRTKSDFWNIAGIFVNMIALRNNPNGSKKISDFISEVKSTVLKAFNYQDYPFDMIVDLFLSGQDRTVGNPIFNILFEYQNEDMRVNNMGNTARFFELGSDTAKFDISFLAKSNSKGLCIDVEFNTSMFKESTISSMIQHLSTIIDFIISNKERKISEIDFLSDDEKHRQLVLFNDTKTNYPSEKTVIELFEEHVKINPERNALGNNFYRLNYRQLDLYSTNIAVELSKKGVCKGNYVGVLCGRSVEAVVLSLAIMKLGGIYVPLDPESPVERLNNIISECKINVVGIIDEYKDLIKEEKVFLISPYKNIQQGNIYSLETVYSADAPAYVMYTSGSTGIPKGTIISHRNIVRLVKNTNYFNFNPNIRIIQTGAPAFDAITFEWWGALLNGGYLHVISKEDLMAPVTLKEQIDIFHINTMWLTSSLFNYLLDQHPVIFSNLEYLLVGGDVLSTKHINKLKEAYPRLNILNGYGPTENTTFSLVHPITEHYTTSIPIGKPISNSKAYILDDAQHLLPLGAVGELYLGGDGVALGYLNDEELTEQKFIDNPFSEGKIYKSGDLAKYLSDGTVEFLGRKDNQIKIRGFRIEIGEIEETVLNHSSIKECYCCIIDERGEKCIACYYIVVNNAVVTPLQLRDYLYLKLPSYMVPSYYKEVDIFYLNQNGKVSRSKLPAPELIKRVVIAPESPLQKILYSYWIQVLNEEEFGIDDDFYALGGQSLKAMTLTSLLLEKEKISLPLTVLFSCTTIRLQEEYLLNNEVGINDIPPIVKVMEQEHYPVSSAQKRLFALQQLVSDSLAYNMPVAFKLENLPDEQAIKKALEALVMRHESLRTNFKLEGEELVQIVSKEAQAYFVSYDASSSRDVDNIINDFIRPFNLKDGELLRTGIIRLFDMNGSDCELENYKAILLFDMHHIISDGVSVQNIAYDFISFLQGKDLPELDVQYKDYAIWEKLVSQTQEYERQREFWKNQLAGDLPVLEIPTDFDRPLNQKFEGNNYSFTFDQKLSEQVNTASLQMGVTPHLFLLASFNILLSLYSNQEDIIIGVPVAGRHSEKLRKIVGMFVNTLPIRTYPRQDKSFRNYLLEVRDCSVSSLENQLFTFEKIVKEINVVRDGSRNPLFDVLFVLQENQDFGLASYPINLGISKFDLMLQGWQDGKQFKLDFEYSTSLFEHTTIELMAKRFCLLVEIFSNNVNVQIKDVDLCLEEEKLRILNEFNNTSTDSPYEKTIIELFADIVAQYGNREALRDGEIRLSYKELNEKADALAHVLNENGVKAGDRVGLFFDRDAEWIISTLAILKVGGVYVPIGTSYPENRIRFVEASCELKVILTNKSIKDLFFQVPVINIVQTQITEKGSFIGNLSHNGDSPCYILFTSGSTGEPKGVVALHKNVIRLVRNVSYLHLDETTRVLLTGSPVFDATTFEIWGPLLNGGCLILADNQILLDAELIGDAIRKNRVNTMWFTSAYFNQLCDQDTSIFETLSYLLVGGDVISPKHIYRVRNLYKHLTIINGYGPTENVTFSATYTVNKEYSRIPIGRAINNSTAYILSKTMKLQPIGIVGELYVGGVGLAMGYLNDAKLTKERFVENPFGDGRLYKTGDLARLLPDGNIDFLGRIDNQIKIRGYRIEPGEIEYVLLSSEFILKALVIPYEKDGTKSLCAYYQSSEPLSAEVVRDFLKDKLPDYMIPTYYVNQSHFSLTENGKIDRRNLPEPEAIKEEYEAPETELETQMMIIWSDVLRVEKIGRNDNFFSLGGDSIKAIQICSRLQDIKLKIEVNDLFQFPVLKDLCTEVRSYKLNIEQGDVIGEANMTPIQHWFSEQSFKNPDFFHQGVSFFSKQGFEKEIIEKTINDLILHHDALRLSFPTKSRIMENLKFGERQFYQIVEIQDIEKEFNVSDYMPVFQDMQKSTSLKKGILTSLLLVHHKGGSHLWWSIHHMVVDGVSWRFLIEDFQNLYQSYCKGSVIKLPQKTTPFIQWAKIVKGFSVNPKLLQEIEYWKNECIAPSNRMCLYQGEYSRNAASRKKIVISRENTTALISKVHNAFNTNVNDILISALVVTLYQWKCVTELQLCMEGHGREYISSNVDISRTVGWFTSIYPVRLEYDENVGLSETIKRVKDKLHRIPRNGIGYGILKYMNEECGTILEKMYPDISFNYLGHMERSSSIGEQIEIEPLSAEITLDNENKMLYPLDINSWIIGENLHINIEYIANVFDDNSIETFVSEYEKALNNIIQYCQSVENSEITLSDLTSSDISESEFSDILDDLDFN